MAWLGETVSQAVDAAMQHTARQKAVRALSTAIKERFSLADILVRLLFPNLACPWRIKYLLTCTGAHLCACNETYAPCQQTSFCVHCSPTSSVALVWGQAIGGDARHAVMLACTL